MANKTKKSQKIIKIFYSLNDSKAVLLPVPPLDGLGLKKRQLTQDLYLIKIENLWN